MKGKTLATLALTGMMLIRLAMPLWAAEMPTEPLGGKPPAGSTVSVKDLDYQVKYQRAFEAVIWSSPAIDIYNIHRANLEVGGGPNVILAWSAGAKPNFEALTPNNVSPYLLSSTNLSKGPVVLEVPAATKTANLFGQIVNHWFETVADIGPIGVDKGTGAKILITPPGYADKVPEGYVEVKSPSFRVDFGFRAIPTPEGKPADAVALGRQLKMYYLSELPDPKPTKFIDPLDMRWSTLPRYDERWFEDLYQIVSVEPVNPRDKVMVGMLKTIGIEKGKPYEPDEKTMKAMRAAVTDAYYYMQELVMSPEPDEFWWPERQWRDALYSDANRGFTWETVDLLDTSSRARHPWFTAIYLPRQLAEKPVTMYLVTSTDSEGKLFEAGKTYSLTVPKDVPVSQFWSLTVYDRETWAFIYSPKMLPGLSSRDMSKMKTNADGSVTLYIGPETPEGLGDNWIPTSGKIPYLMFRFYGPTDPFFDKSFVLADVKLVK